MGGVAGRWRIGQRSAETTSVEIEVRQAADNSHRFQVAEPVEPMRFQIVDGGGGETTGIDGEPVCDLA